MRWVRQFQQSWKRRGRRLLGSALALLLVASWAAAPYNHHAAVASDVPTLNPESNRFTWTSREIADNMLLGTSTVIQNDHTDTLSINVDLPAGFYESNTAQLVVRVAWNHPASNLSLSVASPDLVPAIYESDQVYTNFESLAIKNPQPGTWTVTVQNRSGVPASYTGTAYLAVNNDLTYTDKDLLSTQEIPINIIFAGRRPTPEQIQTMLSELPDQFRPTVRFRRFPETGAQALNTLTDWGREYFKDQTRPAFEPIRYTYKYRFLLANEAYTRALFQAAENLTAQDQKWRGGSSHNYLYAYNQERGHFRGPEHQVSTTSYVDLVDGPGLEDWIFNNRFDPAWEGALLDLTTGETVSPALINPDPNAYHDPYYDLKGPNYMPQGTANLGYSYFVLDTYSPSYAKEYFRPNIYHTFTVDKVENGAVVEHRVIEPDSGRPDGVTFARLWGGRYRFMMLDLGAAPNSYEGATWADRGLGDSAKWPNGDPPIWEILNNPAWSGTAPLDQNGDPAWLGNNAFASKLARDVAYALWMRFTPSWLYTPIPSDAYYLAQNTWLDYYSYEETTWAGYWYSDLHKLYNANQVFRSLQAAAPGVQWIGRPGEHYHNHDVSPKFKELGCSDYHFSPGANDLVPDPTCVDKTPDPIQQIIEKAKGRGFSWLAPDGAVDTIIVMDYIDINRHEFGPLFEDVVTVPTIQAVWEKAYTWYLPLIVGGVAQNRNGEPWGTLSNVNDRFKWSGANKRETIAPPASQHTGRGMTYIVEHETSHFLGLAHPHDATGVTKDGRYFETLAWLYDTTAAPTTYAMSYKPYEVLDQDNLQRGHVAEYLVMANAKLRDLYLQAVINGHKTAPQELLDREQAMVTWMNEAKRLFAKGDYLHAEQAARNSYRATLGKPADPVSEQTAYNVSGKPAQADLTLASEDISITQEKPGEATISATVWNIGAVDAAGVVVRIYVDDTQVGSDATVDLARSGGSATVSVSWSTRAQHGDHVVKVVLDPDNAIAEWDEANNSASRTFTVKGNKVQNGSAESSSSTDGSQPANWSGSGEATWGSEGATDGSKALTVSGAGSWTSDTFAVTAGESLKFATTVAGTAAPKVTLQFLDATGLLTSSLDLSAATGSLTVPAGVTQMRVVLASSDGTPLHFDDVWVW